MRSVLNWMTVIIFISFALLLDLPFWAVIVLGIAFGIFFLFLDAVLSWPRMKFPAEIRLEPFDPNDPMLPGAVKAHFVDTDTVLRDLGFIFEGNFRIEDKTRRSFSCVAGYKNDASRDGATVVCDVAYSDKGMKTISAGIQYGSVMLDDSRVLTNCLSDLQVFKLKWRRTFSFPRVKDARRLFSIHQAVVGRFGGEKKGLPKEGLKDAYSKNWRREIDEMVERGYCSYALGKEQYSYSFKGAAIAFLRARMFGVFLLVGRYFWNKRFLDHAGKSGSR